MRKILGFVEKMPLVSSLFLVLAISVFIYWDFLSSSISFLLSVDDGHDQTWPYLVSLSDYMKNEGYPMWSFGIGLGSPYLATLYGNPFLLLPVLLGRGAIPYAMVIMQICKIVLAFLFFYLFLKKTGFHPFACSTVSILYAFCGIMITRGPWVNYGVECALAAFILYAIEVYLKDGRSYLIPISICLLSMSFGAYYVYLYAILISVYSTARYLHSHKFNIRAYSLYILKIGGICFVGVLMSGFILIPYSFSMFSTFRFDDTTNGINIVEYAMNLFRFDEAIVYLSEFYRFFSSDILGTFSRYSGTGNYLEGPLFYCGLLNLLLIPQVFLFSNNRTRRVVIFGIFSALIYLVFPNIRLIFNGFIRETFKLSSLWVCIIMLAVTANVLDIIANGTVLNKKILLLTFDFIVIALVASLRLISGKGILFFEHMLSVYIVLFLSAYVAIFLQFGRLNKMILMKVLFLVIVLEACCFSYMTVVEEYEDARYIYELYVNEKNKRDYYDYGSDAIGLIKSSDHAFFRLERNYAVRLNDSLFNEYYGSAYYNSLINKSYVKFLSSLNAGSFENFPIWSYSFGLRERPLLSILTAFKYQIVNLGVTPPFGFETITTIIGDKAVYKNDDALPLAFVYDEYILEGDFDSLPVPAKDFTLLNAVVTEKPYDGLRQYGLPLEIQQISESGFDYTEENEDWRRLEGTVGFYDNYIEALDNRKKEPFFITKFSQNHIEGTIDVAGSRMLFFSIPYSEGWTLTVDDNLTSVDKVNIGFIGAQIGAGKHTIKLDYFLPGLFIGGIMSAAGCVIFIVLAWNTASISLRKNSRQAQ